MSPFNVALVISSKISKRSAICVIRSSSVDVTADVFVAVLTVPVYSSACTNSKSVTLSTNTRTLSLPNCPVPSTVIKPPLAPTVYCFTSGNTSFSTLAFL